MKRTSIAIVLALCAGLYAEVSAASPQEYRDIIDRHIQRRWESDHVTAAPEASDAEFLRRVWLDVAGVIPPAGTTREFLEDASPDKREKMTRRLLESSNYVERFSQQWLELLTPEATSDAQLAYVAEELRAWLRLQAIDNTPYDEFVRQLLGVTLTTRSSGAMQYYSTAREPKPTAFYAAKNTAPENLAGASARIFLGLRVDCAQCHDHPFADWKQDDFWSYAAFYQGLGKRNNPGAFLSDLFSKGAKNEVSILIPDTDRRVPARFLNGETPQLKGQQPRRIVADWLVNKDNPFFARAMVNRTWANLLGRGIVDPVDDMDANNPPSHPELLDELAEAFASDFDIPQLVQGIVMSAPYQRSSAKTHSTQADATFARFLPRRLDAKQVQASLKEAFAFPKNAFTPGVVYGVNQMQFDRYFRTSAPPLERSSSVQQALLMMNGQLMRAAGREGLIVRAWVDLPGMTDEDRIEMVYLGVLSRLPSPSERERMLRHVHSSDDLRGALADISWALANSAEFIVNH